MRVRLMGEHPPSGERNKLLMVSRLAQNGSFKKIFVLPCAKMFVLLQPFSARWKTPEERCRSGRSGRSRKPLTSLLVPGFESLSLRKQCKEPKIICLWLYFFYTRYEVKGGYSLVRFSSEAEHWPDPLFLPNRVVAPKVFVEVIRIVITLPRSRPIMAR